MNGGAEKFPITPLIDSSNWKRWRMAMESYLRMHKLWDVVSGKTTRPEEPTATGDV